MFGVWYEILELHMNDIFEKCKCFRSWEILKKSVKTQVSTNQRTGTQVSTNQGTGTQVSTNQRTGTVWSLPIREPGLYQSENLVYSCHLPKGTRDSARRHVYVLSRVDRAYRSQEVRDTTL